jgi:hypothetical protein
MATADVIRDAGDTLVDLLKAGIPTTVVAAADIFVATPDDFKKLIKPARPTITIFLYRISVDSESQSAPRRMLPDGRITRPLLTLDLGVLVTPWANDTRDELAIVGRILQILYEHPQLRGAQLSGSSWDVDDRIQLALDALPPQDQLGIWAAIEIPYRLSLTYRARVIGLAPA